MASAATVGSNLIEGQTVQIKEGPPLFEGEGKDFPKPKPCEKSSSKREAEGLEGKKETAPSIWKVHQNSMQEK